jgi:death-on-curing protein
MSFTDKFLVNVRYLTVAEVMDGQVMQLELYGGGDHGVLNAGSLESAVENARQCVFGVALYNSRFKAAAAYMRGIVLNHAFRNGNKRTALATALEFLHVNGLRIDSSNEALVDFIIDAVTNDVDEETRLDVMAKYFRRHARRIPVGDGPLDCRLDDARRWMHATYGGAFRTLAAQ